MIFGQWRGLPKLFNRLTAAGTAPVSNGIPFSLQPDTFLFGEPEIVLQ